MDFAKMRGHYHELFDLSAIKFIATPCVIYLLSQHVPADYVGQVSPYQSSGTHHTDTHLPLERPDGYRRFQLLVKFRFFKYSCRHNHRTFLPWFS